MSAAIGGSSAPSRSPRGELWVDVRDFGAKADDGVTDNSGPFQAAVDYLVPLVTSRNTQKGVVFVPSAVKSYFLRKSIWVDVPNIEIRGEGWGTRVYMANRHTSFIFGIRRTEYRYSNGAWVPVQITAANRPDLYGKLDSSAVGAPGQRWGLRTNGDSFVQVQGNSMSSGPRSAIGGEHLDYWGETGKLTIEFCMEAPDGQPFPAGAPLLGLGNLPYEPSPFAITMWDEPNKVLFAFRTSDQGPGRLGNNRHFAFRLGSVSGPTRVAVQIDLDNASFSAFVNGVQVPTFSEWNLSPTSQYPFVPGLRFEPNDHYPFMIGMDGFAGTFNNPPGADLRFYGLRVSNTTRYQNNGAGQPQRRADTPSASINDAYAYLGMDANTVCLLPMTDDPASAGRTVTVQMGDQASMGGFASGLFLSTVNGGGIIGNGVRDIQVVSSGSTAQTITIGAVLEFTLENAKVIGGFQALGGFNTFANYLIYIRNCWLEGLDSAFYGMSSIVMARDNFMGRAGRVTIRQFGGSASWENTFVAHGEVNAECSVKIVGSDYGGNFYFGNLYVDFEGERYSRAAIYCESHYVCPTTSLIMRDVFLGTVGGNASLVMLKDVARRDDGAYFPCWLSINNLQAYTYDFRGAIDVDGPLWSGEVRGGALKGPIFYHRKKWGDTTGIVVYDVTRVAPPRDRPWYAGAHVLEVRSPSDGQFTEWRCVAGGAYGTPAPPSWVGMAPLVSDPGAVAAYVLNHGYITANLT